MTPGAYQTTLQGTNWCPIGSIVPCLGSAPTNGFVTKLKADGSGLLWSTYLGTQIDGVTAMTLDGMGNVYFASEGDLGIGLLSAGGNALLHSLPRTGTAQVLAMALDGQGNLLATGSAGLNFQTTPWAFQPAPRPAIPALPGYFGPIGGQDEAFVAKMDGELSKVLAATLVGGEGRDAGQSVAIDAAGNVVVGGRTTSKAFPTRAPFQGAFVPAAQVTGFVAELDNNLSQLIFSTYAGDTRPFEVAGAFPAAGGDVVLAGSTWSAIAGDIPPAYQPAGSIIANRMVPGPAAGLRLDAVVNRASLIATPLAPGEAIEAQGAGFGADAEVLLDGAPAVVAGRSAASVVALVPEGLKTTGAVKVEVRSGGATSNAVLMPAAVAAPGIYSIHLDGVGQGYIRNEDGSFNSPNRPAHAGEAITIFATGVGALAMESGYVVTALPISIYVDGIYADGVGASVGPAGRLPGETYQITVRVPDPAQIALLNPDLKGFTFPSAVAVTMVLGQIVVNGGYALGPDAVASQNGIALYVK